MKKPPRCHLDDGTGRHFRRWLEQAPPVDQAGKDENDDGLHSNSSIGVGRKHSYYNIYYIQYQLVIAGV